MSKRPVNELQADDVEESPRMAETSQNLDETIVRALRQTPREDESANDSGYERGLELVRAIGRDWSLGTPPSDATAGTGEPFEQTVTATGSGPISKGGDDGPLGNIRDYRLLEKLGEGGMGAVYKALQTKLEKVVALKVLPAERLQDDAAVARFEREMKAVGRLDHPNIVRATDAGEHDGQHFLVMEYVDGVDLSQHVKQHGSLSIDNAIEVTRQTANALQYAHERGLVHRDVKPSNVMLASDSQASIRRQPAGDVGRSNTLATDHRADAQCSPVVKLLDLGLARLETEAAAEAQTRDELTTEGSVMGTVDYMSPEQALDTHNADARSDVYSLGCTLYFLLTGKPPYSGKTMMERLVAHREAPIPRVDPASIRRQPADDVERSNTLASDHRANAQCSPEAMQIVLDRMLAKDPGERFQTMAEVVAALDAMERPAHEDDATLAETFEIDTSFVVRPQAAAGRTSAVRKSLIAGGIVTALLIAAVIVFKFKTRNGTLVIEVDDPKNVVVEIDGEKADGAKITADGKAIQLSIAPGTRQLVVKTADGTVLKVDGGKQVEIAAGKERRIKAWVERPQRKMVDERAIAKAIFAKRGAVRISIDGVNSQKKYTSEKQLPGKPFKIWTVSYEQVSNLNSGDAKLLRNLSNLTDISFLATNADDDIADVVSGFSQLKRLNFWSTRISDKGVAKLVRLKNLQNFGVGSKSISNNCLESIGQMKRLVNLQFSIHGYTQQGIKHLNGLNELKGLYIYGSSDLAAIQEIGRLEFLDRLTGFVIAANPQLKDESCRKLLDKLNRFRIANLEFHTTGLSNAICPTLADFENANLLNLAGTLISDQGIQHFSKLRKLTGLTVTGTRVTAAGVTKLKRAIPKCIVLWDRDEPRSKRPSLAVAPFNHNSARSFKYTWAAYLKAGSKLSNTIGMPFQLIPTGRYNRGAAAGDTLAVKDEKPQHQVTLTRPFYMGTYEVTVGQFKEFVKDVNYKTYAESTGKGSFGIDRKAKKIVRKPEWNWRTPGMPSSDGHPVVHLTFDDCVAFCRWLSKKEGHVYRLPTEAEWEYACRAGTTTRYYWGDNPADADKFAWHVGNARGYIKPVGEKSPNAFGLHDMHGNVSEWCVDVFHPYNAVDKTDPVQRKPGKKVATRSGSFAHKASFLRASARNGATPNSLSFLNGFRIVREIPPLAK